MALAGVAQAVYLVQQIAKHGSADNSAIESSIGSILKIDANDIEDVFAGLEGIKIGLRQLSKQLSGPPSIDTEQVNYAATLVFLERKLVKKPKLLQQIRTTLETLSNEAQQLPSVLHENVLTRLAALYQNTISTMSPRILINGEQIYLTNPDNTKTIRALLLAGIRAAFLWRQCGGTRWKFIFFRKRILDESLRLLKQH